MNEKGSYTTIPWDKLRFDTKYAFEKLGCDTEIVWHKESKIPYKTHLVVIAGGFSYGDYLRSGAIAKFSPIMKSVKDYAESGGLTLGICNGFQILTEARLLPGALKRNENLHFISRFQTVRVEDCDNLFLKRFKKGDILNIPIAHADGNYYIDRNGLDELEKNNQILLRYSNRIGEIENVNGSTSSIAGVCNREK